LGDKAKGRGKVKSETGFELREQQAAYGNFDLDNTFYWDR